MNTEDKLKILIEAMIKIRKVPKNHDGIDNVRFLVDQTLEKIK